MSTAELTWTPGDTRIDVHSYFENAPLGWAQCDDHGHVTALNPVLEEKLGIRAEARFSLNLSDLIHSQQEGEAERLLSDLLTGKRDKFQVDSASAPMNGQSMRWTVWRVPKVNTDSECVLAVAEDLPIISEAEQRLRQAERLETVGRLAGGLAHDFNNLLTGVLLYCDLLMASIEPGHRARKYAEEIRKAGMQASALVRQLLSIARPSNSQPKLLSLNEIAEGMRNLLVRLVGETVDLNFSLDANLGLVKMDPTQAQQILLNLVLNARDAMPRGGQITVETRNCRIEVLTDFRLASGRAAPLPCALFVVTDNGNGMDAETRAHLFEPFFTTKGSKGTGLGLATVHDIVSSNGGLIHVDSAPGEGTRVSVLMPLIPGTVLPTLPPVKFQPVNSCTVLSSNEED